MNPSMTRWKIVPSYSLSVVFSRVAGWVHSRRPSARSAKLATVFGAWSGKRSTVMSPWLVCSTARRAGEVDSVTMTSLPRLGPGPWAQAAGCGGDEGNRTPNPRLAKAVLCQLSYAPEGGSAVGSAGRRGADRLRAPGRLVPEVGLGFSAGALLHRGQGAGGDCGQ